MTSEADESNRAGDPQAGDEGSFAEVQFPQLLLDLYHGRFSGPLELSRNKTTKRITFHLGAPIHSESNLANESLGIQLIDQGELSRADHERVSAYMERKQCREGVALLALELIEPKGLFLALKEQVRRRILETFAWSDGSYQLLEPEEMKKEVQPMRSDPLALIREGLLNHWTPDRLLADLTPYIELFPNRTPAFEEAERLLAIDEETSSLLDRIDGSRNLGETIGSGFNSSQILATIWILTQGRLIHFAETTVEREEEEEAEEPDDELLTIEIEIATARETESSSSGDRSILATESNVGSTRVRRARIRILRSTRQSLRSTAHTRSGRQSKTITLRAAVPLRIASKASFTCSSGRRAVIISSSLSAPLRYSST